MYATVAPDSRPVTSRTVMQSARTWQGCSASVRALITGDVRCRGDRHQVPVRHEPRHDPVGVAIEDPADVRRRLAFAELDLGVEERDRMPAEAVDRHLEGHAGAVARPLEDERKRAARERAAEITPRLGRIGQVEDGDDLVGAEVRDAEQIATGERWTHPPIWLHRDANSAPRAQRRARSVTRYTVLPWISRSSSMAEWRRLCSRRLCCGRCARAIQQPGLRSSARPPRWTSRMAFRPSTRSSRSPGCGASTPAGSASGRRCGAFVSTPSFSAPQARRLPRRRISPAFRSAAASAEALGCS